MSINKNTLKKTKYSDSICFLIPTLARKILRLHNKSYSKYKITAGQSFILFDLLEYEGSSMTEISNRVQLDTPSITGYINRLIKEDLVIRIDDPNDRRLSRISLTDKGKDITKLLLPKTQKVHNNIIELLDIDDFETFDKCLLILERNL